jgi:hypothetical protein
MASTGINNGTLISVYLGGVAISHCTSHSMSIEQAMRDISTKSSAGWKEIAPGQRSGGCEFESMHAEDATYGYADLFALITSRASVSLVWSTGVSGDEKYTATAYLTSLEKEAPNEDNETYSGSFEFSGSVVKSTI